jgi:tetratricopeptide (TPR) repeat protein
MLAMAERAEPALSGPDQRQWYELLTDEIDNVREALAFATARGDGERALMLVGTLWRFWWNKGHIEEASTWLDRAFAVAARCSDRARARGLFALAHMADARGEVERSHALFREAEALFRAMGDTRWLVLALTHRSNESEAGRAVNEEALSLALEAGDVRGAAIVRMNIAGLLLDAGDDQRAEPELELTLEGMRAAGDWYGVANALWGLGEIALRRGDVRAAAANLRESIRLSWSIGDVHSLATMLSDGARLTLALGDAKSAARIQGAVSTICAAHGFEFDPEQSKLYADVASAVRRELGELYGSSWDEGAALALDAAVELTIHALGEATWDEASPRPLIG